MTEVPLHVTIVGATGLRAMDANGTSDPYVKLYLKSNEEQILNTEVKENELNPVWNAEFDLVTHDPENDELRVCLYDKDILRDDRMIDEIQIPINEIIAAAPNDYVFDKDVVKTDDKNSEKVTPSGRVNFTVKATVPQTEVKQRDVNVEGEKDCVFDWGSYGSTYSTDFTGYTTGEFESLGELTPSNETIHHHSEPHFSDKEVKPKSLYSVHGTLHGFTGLINPDEGESDIYATLQLYGKSAIDKGKKTPIRTTIVRGNLNPEYNYEFNFDEAKKGDTLVIQAIQNHNGLKDVVIGVAKVEIKNAEGEKEYDLVRPKNFEIKGNFPSFGKVRLTLQTEKTENFAANI